MDHGPQTLDHGAQFFRLIVDILIRALQARGKKGNNTTRIHSIAPHSHIDGDPHGGRQVLRKALNKIANRNATAACASTKPLTLEEDQEVQHKQGNGSATSGGDDGVPGVLGGSSGTAAKCEEQEPPAGMRAMACSSSPAMSATGIRLKSVSSSWIHLDKAWRSRVTTTSTRRAQQT